MRGRSGLIGAVLIVALTLAAGPTRAHDLPPDEAIAAAVAMLEQQGYVASFARAAEPLIHGEVRYQASDAYSLLLETDPEAAVEYILLDPFLYIRVRRDDAWGDWERRPWHPDVPVQDLAALHPRLPLELLRNATNLRDTVEDPVEPGGLRTIEGIVSFTAAFYAAYEDLPPTPSQRAAVLSTRWPLTVRLDPATGRIVQLVLETREDDGTASGTLSYTFAEPAPPNLTPPPDAVDRGGAVARAAPELPVRGLPLEISGQSTAIGTPPFRAGGGTIVLTIDANIDGVQYQIWRIKRGRLLSAGLGAALANERPIVVRLDLVPGDYLVEIQLPDSVSWTLSIEAQPPREAAEAAER